MSGIQKRAWFIVLICLAAVVFSLILMFFVGSAGFAGLGLFGFAGFAPLIGRKEKTDERDRMIARRAVMVAGLTSYCTFIAGCMGVWFVKMIQGQEVVEIMILPNIVIFGGLMFFMSHAVMTLVMYGRKVEADCA